MTVRKRVIRDRKFFGLEGGEMRLLNSGIVMGGGDQSDYEGRMRGGIIGFNGGGSQGGGVHKVVSLVLHSIGR